MLTVYTKELKFIPGGDTMWVTAPDGEVLMRVRCREKIIIGERDCRNIVCHADMITSERITVGNAPSEKVSIPDDKGMVTIPAGGIQFYPNGNSVWLQAPEGATILRIRRNKQPMPIFIKDMEVYDVEEEGKLFIDITVPGTIEMCLVASVAAQMERIQ